MAQNPGQSSQVRIAFKIGYLGGGFAGSQYQPDMRTVAGEIEAACIRAGLFSNRREGHLILSGRTDRGVHARCQILAITTPFPDRAVRALNGQLPPDIWATAFSVAPDSFYPRYDVIDRTYRYYFAQIPSNLDLLSQACVLFRGEHDFTCFSRLEPGKNPIRIIQNIDVHSDPDGSWIEVTAESYLWHMVRSIAGAALDVSEGKMTLQQISRMLKGECTNKAKPAPPDGLILWDVTCDLVWEPMNPVARTKEMFHEKESWHHMMARIYSVLPDWEI